MHKPDIENTPSVMNPDLEFEKGQNDIFTKSLVAEKNKSKHN
jgi:hypothetical protein